MLQRVLTLICCLLLFVFLVSCFLKPVETEDIWWHLAAGRNMVKARAVPHTDPFTFRSEPIPWTLNQWLGSLAYFLIYDVAGLNGLRAFRVLIFLSILSIFVWFARGKISVPWLFFMIFLMTFGIERRAHLRPHVFNYIFIQIQLILLLKYRETNRWRYLLPLPFLGMIWYNLHLGCAIYGLLIQGIFIVTTLFECVGTWLGLGHNSRPKNQHAACQLGELFMITALFMAAWLINPYGIKGALFPFRVFLDQKFILFYDFRQLILEMKPPDDLLSPQALWFWILGSWSVLGFLQRKKKDLLTEMLLLLAFIGYIRSRRLAAIFALMAGYTILLNHIALQKNKKTTHHIGRENWILVLMILILGITISRRIHTSYFKNGRFHNPYFMTETYLAPSRQLQILHQINPQGVVLNTDVFGGYMLFHHWPTLQPFIDGRQLDLESHIIYHRVIQSPEIYWNSFEKQFHINAILLIVKGDTTLKFLQYIMNSPYWQLIDLDGPTVLFVRRGLSNLSQELTQYELRLSRATLDLRAIRAMLNTPTPIPSLESAILNFITPAPQWVDLWTEGRILYALGFRNAGIMRITQSLPIVDAPKRREVLRKMLNVMPLVPSP